MRIRALYKWQREGKMLKYGTNLKEKLIESLKSVLPISIIVLILCFTVSPIDISNFTSFIAGSVLLVVGVALFTIGADMSMTPMGEYVGAQMTKSKKIWLIILLSFVVGAMITISEPDLQVLAKYVPSINSTTLILSVAAGVGAFLVVAMLRILFGIKLKYLLIGFYAVVFILASFVDKEFWTIAFDAGGVTTGPMTVPFIMALGVGVSSIRSDSRESNDSFGLVSLCSIGPIIAVLVLGLIHAPETSSGAAFEISQLENSRQLGLSYIKALPEYSFDVLKAVMPIVAFFLIYQLFTKPITKNNLFKILIGVAYTCVGLILFLTGANVGFMPAGYLIGSELGATDYRFIVVPIGMIVGYFIVAAEPAVQVLQKQVEDVTSGAIPKRALSFSLEIGVAVSVGIAMLRVITGVSIIYPIAIGYALAIILSFFVPEIFTSIAFDSGGVASGTMTATFLIAFSIGTCEAVGGNIITDAFGMVAMVAMTPLIAIQILGLVYKSRIKSAAKATEATEETIVDFDGATSSDAQALSEDTMSMSRTTTVVFDTEIIDF